MRDPERIERILGKVSEIWLENPDLRLGQLIVNAFRDGDASAGISGDYFYVEDDELEAGLDKHLAHQDDV